MLGQANRDEAHFRVLFVVLQEEQPFCMGFTESTVSDGKQDQNSGLRSISFKMLIDMMSDCSFVALELSANGTFSFDYRSV